MKNLSESQQFVVIKHTFREASAVYWEEEDVGVGEGRSGFRRTSGLSKVCLHERQSGGPDREPRPSPRDLTCQVELCRTDYDSGDGTMILVCPHGTNRITKVLIRGRQRRCDQNKGHKKERARAQECRQSLKSGKDPETDSPPV